MPDYIPGRDDDYLGDSDMDSHRAEEEQTEGGSGVESLAALEGPHAYEFRPIDQE